MTVAEKVKEYCEDHGMAYRELADKLGMTEISMSRFIRGERLPKLVYLKNIAIVLGVTLDELLEGEQND